MDSSDPPSKRVNGFATHSTAGSLRQQHSRNGNSQRWRHPSGAPIPSRPRAWGLSLVLVLSAGYALAVPGTSSPVSPEPPRGIQANIVTTLVVMILIVALLSIAEAVFAGLRRTRVRQLVEEGARGAEPAQRLLEEPSRLLSATQIGITLASMLAAAVAVAARMPEHLAESVARFAARHGLGWLAGSALEVGLVLTVLAIGFLVLLFGELIPRQLALRNSEAIALRLAGPLEALSTLTYPPVRVFTALTNAVVRLFGVTGEAAVAHLTEEEIKNIVEESEKEGVLEEQETEMIHSVLEFTDIVVREVMVPRIDMVCVEAERTLDDLLETVLTSGHTRIPIYEDAVDNIVGIVHAKDLLRVVREGSRQDAIRSANIMRATLYVPENMKVDDLLAEFQRTKHQLAIVVDEYGGTAGLVTLEDLLEEIVGPITDEYDVENEPSLSMLDDAVALVDARMSIDDVNEQLGINIPEEGSETLGGFVFSILGKIPAVGETVEYDSLRIEIVEADSRRVTRVRIIRQDTEATEETPVNGSGNL